MTALEPVGAEYARQLTDRIKGGLEDVWGLITEAFTSRAWAELGYASWDLYCDTEFKSARLRLPAEDRISTVKSLRSAGLSIRAIVAATGVSDQTIQKDLKVGPPVVNHYTSANDEVADAEIVDDEFAQRIANEMAASDAAYAETAQAVTVPMVTGIDGKQYSAKSNKKAARKALTADAEKLGSDIRKVIERLERLVSDKRLVQYEQQVADALRGHLQYAVDTATAVLAQLP
jgi:hypothetical protein